MLPLHYLLFRLRLVVWQKTPRKPAAKAKAEQCTHGNAQGSSGWGDTHVLV
jgi:hypothetical protein